LDLKILNNVNTHLMNSHKFILIYFVIYKFEFCEMISCKVWYH
jgi:hypothetical protein